MQEIQRDEELVAGNLLRNLGRLIIEALDGLLLDRQRPNLSDLHDRVDELLAGTLRYRRQLNDHRISRRGGRHSAVQSPEAVESVPEAARPFAHQGAYIGAYPSMQAVGAHFLGADATATTRFSRYDLTGFGLDLHLNSVLWTIEIDGELHTFQPSSREPGDTL